MSYRWWAEEEVEEREEREERGTKQKTVATNLKFKWPRLSHIRVNICLLCG